MMVYGNATEGEDVTFRVYDPDQQALYDVSNAVAFVPDATYGAYDGLLALVAGGEGEKLELAPSSLQLSGNYPNPLRAGGSTVIRFGLPSTEHVTLRVFDLAGRARATVVDRSMRPGWHEVRFDGSRLPAGVYFYRLDAGRSSESRKLVILR